MASKKFSQFTEKSISDMQSGGGKVVGYMDGENTKSDASELASKTYVDTGLTSKIGDAPNDNFPYVRRNSIWTNEAVVWEDLTSHFSFNILMRSVNSFSVKYSKLLKLVNIVFNLHPTTILQRLNSNPIIDLASSTLQISTENSFSGKYIRNATDTPQENFGMAARITNGTLQIILPIWQENTSTQNFASAIFFGGLLVVV